MKRFNAGVLFTMFWFGTFVFLYFRAADWPAPARRFPLTMLTIGLVLCLIQAGREIFRMFRPSIDEDIETFADLPVDRSIPIREVMVRALTVLAWFVGLVLTTWLLGFFVAVPLFVFIFVTVHLPGRWWVGLIMAASMWAVTFFLFHNLLRIPWPESVLFS